MNRYRKLVIIIAIFISTTTTIFIPWEYTFQNKGISQVVKPAGYHLIFLPPEPESDNPIFGVRVDFQRYLIQIFGLGILFGGLYFLLKEK